MNNIMNGNGNNGKRNFRRFGNNKNNNRNRHNNRGGRFNNNLDDGSDINPQQRRNFAMKRDTHLAKAKELLSAGERVDAEYHLQHADHFHRMSILGLDKQREFQQQNNHNNEQNLQPENTPEANTENSSQSTTPEEISFISSEPLPQKPAEPAPGIAAPGIADLPFMQN